MSIRSDSVRPEKPRKDYPLFAHRSGQWAKKIHGKLHYFGVWADPVAAESEYHRRVGEISGTPDDPGVLTVINLCNIFLNTKQVMVDDGELKQRTWNEYKAAGERLVTFFGPSRPVHTLKSRDFERLRAALPKTWKTISVNNFIIRTKAILNYAYNEELIAVPIRTGEAFKRASQKRLRIVKAESESKFYTAEEIHQLIKASGTNMKAMIHLAVNLGFGNNDCSQLKIRQLDLRDGWFHGVRTKTGISRVGKMWPETMAAVVAAIDSSSKVRERSDYKDHVFLTIQGNLYCRPGFNDALAKEFSKVAKSCGVYRKGVGFYALRHVTQTIGEGSGDLTAVRVLMGHVDSTISETYRAHFDSDRVKIVSDHIRQWFLEGSSEKKP